MDSLGTQVLSVGLNPSGHFSTHSPLSTRLKNKQALQSVGNGLPLVVRLHPELNRKALR